ncbi:glycosyltransferase family 4 protein [Pedobacter agri]|uniref:glycosyltransferase family 4 protein n=1 Tax=Pedobacter agri TaxID=454586 RepID=UPI002930EA2F|nr:glycosyltransferase family 4 protein [Pedobacter agri]
MNKLAIIISHPIQYYVPVFQLLAKGCDLKVFYTWGKQGIDALYDPDFKKNITWDLPLLEGYTYEFQENVAKNPGSHHFSGIVNPHLSEQLTNFAPHAILVYSWAYKSHLQVIRKFKGKIPIWFRGDSTLLDEQQGLKKILRNFFLKWVYQHVDHAFYVGSANKIYFQKFGLAEKQLAFAPHAVDNDRFGENRLYESIRLRDQLNIASTDLLILFAGKLEAKKKPELLLQAFLDLDSPNTHLLFVGNGELEERLKDRKAPRQAQNDIYQRIHFMDFQNQMQMPVIYQACDLFCLPSQGPGETWGMAVNEAMACSKAVLVSDKVGCAADLVQKGINGEIFQTNNITDLKSKLLDMVNDSVRLIEMGKMSRKIIQSWSFDKQAKQILNLLNETC